MAKKHQSKETQAQAEQRLELQRQRRAVAEQKKAAASMRRMSASNKNFANDTPGFVPAPKIGSIPREKIPRMNQFVVGAAIDQASFMEIDQELTTDAKVEEPQSVDTGPEATLETQPNAALPEFSSASSETAKAVEFDTQDASASEDIVPEVQSYLQEPEIVMPDMQVDGNQAMFQQDGSVSVDAIAQSDTPELSFQSDVTPASPSMDGEVGIPDSVSEFDQGESPSPVVDIPQDDPIDVFAQSNLDSAPELLVQANWDYSNQPPVEQQASVESAPSQESPSAPLPQSQNESSQSPSLQASSTGDYEPESDSTQAEVSREADFGEPPEGFVPFGMGAVSSDTTVRPAIEEETRSENHEVSSSELSGSVDAFSESMVGILESMAANLSHLNIRLRAVEAQMKRMGY